MNSKPGRFRGAITLHSTQEYAVVHLPSGSYVAIYGDGTRGAGCSAALARRPGGSTGVRARLLRALHR